MLLVDDNHDLLGELIAVIEAEPGFDVVGSTTAASEAASLRRWYELYVALIDCGCPAAVSTSFCASRSCPATRRRALAQRDPKIVMAMLRAARVVHHQAGSGPDDLIVLQSAAERSDVVPLGPDWPR